MNIVLQKYITAACMTFGSFVFGQFNTLKPSLPKKEEAGMITDINNIKSIDTEKEKERKEKKFLKKIFGGTTKTDLKNEIDSLKIMIKQRAASVSKQEIWGKTKDSIVVTHHSKMLNNNKSSKEQPVIYDLIDESREGDVKVRMPLKRKISVTSSYGARRHPLFGTTRFHNGIDMAARYENVYSVLDGTVSETGWDSRGGGNYIKIRHFNRFETSYLHLSEIYYRTGELVRAGFIIAKSGNSGNSTGPHLHFSVKEYGQSINPVHFLNDLIKVNNLIAIYNE